MNQHDKATHDIIVVDDNPANLELLAEVLEQRGYRVRSFPLGRLALAAAVKSPPDLFLLDITMPEMSGYELCRKLKSNELLAPIPVIFLSALNELESRVDGFQAGAVDYISKPFQFAEVHARVATHLQLSDLRRQLTRQNERLEAVVAQRTRELAAANQKLAILDRTKSEFLSLISHEFRTPLYGVLGAGEIILDKMPASEENNELRGVFQRSRARILSILDDAVLLTRIDVLGERFQAAQASLGSVLEQAILQAGELARSRGVALPSPLGASFAARDLVSGDADLLVHALRAVLEAAVKLSERGGSVRLSETGRNGRREVTVEAEGASIPTDVLARFFDIFAVTETIVPGGDLGLGPAVARRILELFGGLATVENASSGVRFELSLVTVAEESDGPLSAIPQPALAAR